MRECEVDVYLPGHALGLGVESGTQLFEQRKETVDGEGGHHRERVERRSTGEGEGEVVRLHLIDTPGLDTSSPVALDRSLADVLRVIEARFEESLEDVRASCSFLFFFS